MLRRRLHFSFGSLWVVALFSSFGGCPFDGEDNDGDDDDDEEEDTFVSMSDLPLPQTECSDTYP